MKEQMLINLETVGLTEKTGKEISLCSKGQTCSSRSDFHKDKKTRFLILLINPENMCIHMRKNRRVKGISLRNFPHLTKPQRILFHNIRKSKDKKHNIQREQDKRKSTIQLLSGKSNQAKSVEVASHTYYHP